jgi:hypothetical protein
MKQHLLLKFQFAAAVFLFISCGVIINDPVTGNRNVITERREIGAFSILDVSSDIEVVITFGEEPSLEVEADENLMDVIRTEIQDDRLKIYSRRYIRRAKTKKIHLSVPTLREIEASGAAMVRSGDILKAVDLELEVSSAARLFLNIETEKTKVEISSAAFAELNGTTGELDAEVHSAGRLVAGELVSRFCGVEVSSAGHAEVNAGDELDAEASSAGIISYTGEPVDKRIETSSAGRVNKK